jgi:hypothetical protein
VTCNSTVRHSDAHISCLLVCASLMRPEWMRVALVCSRVRVDGVGGAASAWPHVWRSADTSRHSWAHQHRCAGRGLPTQSSIILQLFANFFATFSSYFSFFNGCTIPLRPPGRAVVVMEGPWAIVILGPPSCGKVCVAHGRVLVVTLHRRRRRLTC